MTPLLQQAVYQALSDRRMMLAATSTLDNEVFEYAVSGNLIKDVTITLEGILLEPMQDPNLLAALLETSLEVCFTRELTDGGLYNWVTMDNLLGVRITILAGEFIDLTGTKINTNPQPK